jgi:TonB family protein
MISAMLMAALLQEPAARPVDSSSVVEPVIAPELPVRRHPRAVDGYSEAGDAAGHTGRVIVETIVQPDGTIGPVTVVQSSRSDLLDAEAIQTIATARIAGRPDPIRYHIVVNFNPTGILDMKCEEFTRQVRWYQSVWPESSPGDMTIYTMSVGAMALVARERSGSVDAMLAPARKMEAEWPGLMADCERQPNRVYLQVLNARLN